VPADTPLQLAELLDLQDRMPDGFAVVITGRLAEAGRIMAAARGAALSYASVDPDDPGHPDQPDIHRLHDILAIETVSPSTRFFAIVGHPVAHSMSPAYHTTVFRQTGIDARMVMLDTDGLSDLMAMSDALNLDGFAVTHPFKQDALGHAASALPGAQATGAANTLLRTPAGWQARNTDWKAACDLLPRILRGWRKKHEGAPRALLLGSGGAARAIAIALADTDADVSVWSRNHDHARALAKDLETVALSNLDGLTADLIINATPVGMAGVDGSALPLSEQNFAPEALALDLAYGGDDSPFRQAAQAAGAQLTTGEDFFAIQARRQAELFCGTPIAADVHKEASRRCGAAG
jgi:3-dehydroquinate dehydratase/shikimate dehydrogenase